LCSAKAFIALVESAKFLVSPEITYRTKTPASLRAKLVARVENGESKYTTVAEVGKDAWDIIGFRVTTFVPTTDLTVIEGLLNKTFTLTVWKRGDPNGKYPGNNYRGTYNGVAVEVQTRGALDHAFLQVEHKVRACGPAGGEAVAGGGGDLAVHVVAKACCSRD
jgi:ppGpp synthetase/RelA/SpoT-type nucleotidyltranferase